MKQGVRRVPVRLIEEAVRKGVRQANVVLTGAVRDSLRKAASRETHPGSKEAIGLIVKNFLVAEREGLPLCQDTGLTVVLLQVGQAAVLTGGGLVDAVNRGVAAGTKDAALRMSVVADPLARKNTGTNTPAVLHVEIVEGDRIRVTVMPKGGGAENMSFLRMLSPAVSAEEIESIVVEGVRKAGTNPCPPIVVGIGLGGNFELCPFLAKKALLRTTPNRDKRYQRMESSILKRINALGIGPQTPAGGNTTALAVRIETAPCHIASLPMAVNINCHSHRIWKTVL